MTARFEIAPVSTAASGKTSCTLNVLRPPRSLAAAHPVRPSVSGGDIDSTASTLRGRPPARSARMPTSALNARNPSARRSRFDFDRPPIGCTRVTEPHAVSSVRHGRPPQPSSTACERYHGSAVTTWSSWPRCRGTARTRW
ncbi:MAG: hypothetical protein EBU70_07465, partial [Actinobacteria bacterium]|nr:hypothetical protein [Actinomycetota bacterium]